RGPESWRALDPLSMRAPLVDAEVIDDWLHRKRQRILQLFFQRRHDLLNTSLRRRLNLGRKDERHSSPAHSTQHQEAPILLSEFLSYARNEPFGKVIARPRNTYLNRLMKVSSR